MNTRPITLLASAGRTGSISGGPRVRSPRHDRCHRPRPTTAPTGPLADRVPAVPPLRAVSGADLEVPLVDGSTRRYVNLDYAASAPALTEVLDELGRVLPYYASVHRGAGYASAVSTTAYERARQTIAELTGATAEHQVIFARNTTDALNLLAQAVPAGVEVVCLDIEHHANLLPWLRIGATVLTARPTFAETLELLATELARPEVGLLAVTGASNVTGELLPLERIAALCAEAGVRLAVDGAQLVPHRDVDLAALGIDYLAFSGHKTYAPFGAGVLVGRSDWLDAAPAYLAGGGAVRRVETERTDWTTGPARHEGGTPNVLGAVTLAAACRALSGLGRLRRDRHERALLTRLQDGSGPGPGAAPAADLRRQHRLGRHRRVHPRRLRPRPDRRLSLRRARDRGPGREVLRPSPAEPARLRRRCGPGQRRARLVLGRRRRAADRPASAGRVRTVLDVRGRRRPDPALPRSPARPGLAARAHRDLLALPGLTAQPRSTAPVPPRVRPRRPERRAKDGRVRARRSHRGRLPGAWVDQVIHWHDLESRGAQIAENRFGKSARLEIVPVRNSATIAAPDPAPSDTSRTSSDAQSLSRPERRAKDGRVRARRSHRGRLPGACADQVIHWHDLESRGAQIAETDSGRAHDSKSCRYATLQQLPRRQPAPARPNSTLPAFL